MTDHPNSGQTSDDDYEAIEAAVLETARGRWFLAEYARRNRVADTDVLLKSIGRLEEVVVAGRTSQDAERIRFELTELLGELAEAREAVSTGGAGTAVDALAGLAARLEQPAPDPSVVASAHRAVTALRRVEARLVALAEIWGLDTARSACIFRGIPRLIGASEPMSARTSGDLEWDDPSVQFQPVTGGLAASVAREVRPFELVNAIDIETLDSTELDLEWREALAEERSPLAEPPAAPEPADAPAPSATLAELDDLTFEEKSVFFA